MADPVYTSREFYGVNTDAAGLVEPQFLSTLFWRAGAIVDNTGEVKFSFPTGDITGKFRIVIQGLSSEDVIFSEGGFLVK